MAHKSAKPKTMKMKPHEGSKKKTPHAKKAPHLKDARALGKASRTRTPGWAAGSKQDKLQRKMAGKESAKEYIRATIKHNKKKKKAAKKKGS